MKLLGRSSVLISRIRRSSRQAKMSGLVIALTLLAVPVVYFVHDVRGRLDASRKLVSESARVQVVRTTLMRPDLSGVELFTARSAVREIAEFRGRIFAATSGGLVALGGEGQTERVYTVLDGLPEDDLAAVAVFQNTLFAGTRHAGLLSFDGTRFTQYLFKHPAASRVTVLQAAQEELLIGTFDGGLFEYDGQTFTQHYQRNKAAGFRSVTTLFSHDSRLYVGTQDQGLYVFRDGLVDRFTRNEGLPSNRVTAIEYDGRAVIVATDFGTVEVNPAGQLEPFNPTPNVTSLAEFDGHLYAGLFTGEVVELRQSGKPSSANVAATGSLPLDVRLNVAGEHVWAATSNGLYRLSGLTMKPFALQPEGDPLRHAHVTSLAFDWASRLWVGYFDGGVDVIIPSTAERFTQFEDDALREVNFLRLDRERERMLAATSAGLVVFGSRLEPRRYTENDGLIGDSVSHIELASNASFTNPAADERAVVVSTGKGLTFLSGSVPKSLSAFNGLTSNYIYTSLAIGGRLYAGTLGGLSEVERMRVMRTYTVSNSRLAANWVTALANVDGTLFVGTNGGGVQALTPAGEWLDFNEEIGRFNVNQNAMLFDGRRLLVGTAERGVMIFDTRNREWRQLTAGLAAYNVTAIAADEGHYYFGTTSGITRVDHHHFD